MGTPASSTTKTGRHDIAESGIKHNKINQPKFKQLSITYKLNLNKNMMKKYSEKVKCGEKLKFIAVYMALCYGKC